MRNFSAVIGHGSWAQAWQTSVHVRTRDWNGACDERARMFPSMSARAASLFSSRAASIHGGPLGGTAHVAPDGNVRAGRGLLGQRRAVAPRPVRRGCWDHNRRRAGLLPARR